MNALRVRPYVEADAALWDAFCATSPHATFLHSRRFLSYHGSRFADRSCIIERDGRCVGLFPAAVARDDAGCVVSHPGATFGGLVHDGSLAGAQLIEALRQLAGHYAAGGFSRLRYRAVPHIYHAVPSQDDIYALAALGARRTRCDLSCAIDLDSDRPPSNRRRRGVRKAQDAGVTITTGVEQLPEYWPLLTASLARHRVTPVHTIAEITLLASRFASSIEFHGARLDGVMVAGTVLFIHPRVHHAQYVAASETGRDVAALDAVFAHVIARARGRARFFDFGISTEDEGRRLNDGLHGFKREFGGGGVVHEHFELDFAAAEEAEPAPPA